LLHRLARKKEPQGQNGTEMHREWEYRTFEQGISNDEGREATKAERREGTQRDYCTGLQGKRNHGVKTAWRGSGNGNFEHLNKEYRMKKEERPQRRKDAKEHKVIAAQACKEKGTTGTKRH